MEISHQDPNQGKQKIHEQKALDTQSQSSDATLTGQSLSGHALPHKEMRQYPLIVEVDAKSRIYFAKPNASQGERVIENALWKILSSREIGETYVYHCAEQRVSLSLRAEGARADAHVEPIGLLHVQLRRGCVYIEEARDLKGSVIDLSKAARACSPIISEQQLADRLKWQQRFDAILRVKQDPLGLITVDEYRSYQKTDLFPESFLIRMKEIESAFNTLFLKEMANEVKSKSVGWAQEIDKIAMQITKMHESVSPHFDALLLVLDPENTRYRGLVSSQTFRDFIQRASTPGIFARFSAVGKASLVIAPILKQLSPAVPKTG